MRWTAPAPLATRPLAHPRRKSPAKYSLRLMEARNAAKGPASGALDGVELAISFLTRRYGTILSCFHRLVAVLRAQALVADRHLDAEQRPVLLAAKDVRVADAAARQLAEDGELDRQARLELDVIADARVRNAIEL